jgi:hypothetical protein
MDNTGIITILLFAFGILFSIIGTLCLIILNGIRSDIKTLYTKFNEQDKRLIKLETEHENCKVCQTE